MPYRGWCVVHNVSGRLWSYPSQQDGSAATWQRTDGVALVFYRDLEMAWTNAELLLIWKKAAAVINDPDNGSKFRKDACGAWIGFAFYGDRTSQYGWEVDHINPKGGDGIANLRPLQWENNVAKSDGKLVCVKTASGVANVSAVKTKKA